jgi:hypothetical protein
MPWRTIWDDQLPPGTTIGQADEDMRRIELRVENPGEFDRGGLEEAILAAIGRDVGPDEQAKCPEFVYTLSRLKRRC